MTSWPRPDAISRRTRSSFMAAPAWSAANATRLGPARPHFGRGPAPPARERHDPRRDAVGLERLGRAVRELQLRPGPDQDDLRLLAAGRVAQDIAAAAESLARLLGRARERRQLLTSQRQRNRPRRIVAVTLDRERPRGGRLVGVSRPNEPQVGDRAEPGVILDRLVGRAVRAQPDPRVGPDADVL